MTDTIWWLVCFQLSVRELEIQLAEVASRRKKLR